MVETTCPLARVAPDDSGDSDLGTDILPPPPAINVGADDYFEAEIFAPKDDDDANSAIPDWLENEFNDAASIRFSTLKPVAVDATAAAS